MINLLHDTYFIFKSFHIIFIHSKFIHDFNCYLLFWVLLIPRQENFAESTWPQAFLIYFVKLFQETYIQIWLHVFINLLMFQYLSHLEVKFIVELLQEFMFIFQSIVSGNFVGVLNSISFVEQSIHMINIVLFSILSY